MKNERFNEILERRIDSIRSVLGSKAIEYVRDEDRLYNFKRAAEKDRTSPAKALWGMALKHRVSVSDLVEEVDCVIEDVDVYKALINEKIGDLINYLILLEAILKENLDDESI